MHIIALVLLTLVGYSVGAALGGRKRTVSPQLLDLGLIVVLWVAALLSRPLMNKWTAVGVWMIAAGMIAFLRTSARRARLPANKKATAILPENASFWARLWAGWKQFSQQMGNFQGRVLLAFFYLIVVTPFGLLVRLFSDPLHIKHHSSSSFWLERTATQSDLEQGRSQF